MWFLIALPLLAFIMVICFMDNQTTPKQSHKNEFTICCPENGGQQIAIPDWVNINGVDTYIKEYDKVFVEGNRLAYRDILADDCLLLAEHKPYTFKKGDIVVLNDHTLWEIKTAHKNGTYTLTKANVKNKKVNYKDIKNKIIMRFRGE